MTLLKFVRIAENLKKMELRDPQHSMNSPIDNHIPPSGKNTPPISKPELGSFRQTGKEILVLAAVLGASILLLDLSLPLGVAGGVPYVALVLIGWWFPNRSWIFLLAAVSSILTIAGYVFSPEGGVPWMVMTNRTLALFVIWTTAAFLASKAKSNEKLRKNEEKLRSLYLASDEHSRIQTITNHIARAISSTLEPQNLLRTIVCEIRRVVPCNRCVISSVDISNKSYHLWHIETEYDDEPLMLRDSDGFFVWISQEVYEARQLQYISDIKKSDLKWTSIMEKKGFRSTLFVPILQDGRCIAHIALSDTRVDAFSADQQYLLTSIASHLGAAIRNASLYQESNKKSKQLATLLDIAQRLTRELDYSEVLKSIAEGAARLFGGESGFRVREGEEMVLVAATDVLAERLNDRIPVESSISGYVAKTGNLVVTADSENDPEVRTIRGGIERNSKSSALLCVPVKLGDLILGSLHVQREKGFIFDDEDIRIATALADQAAIAIENSRLHEKVSRSEERVRTVMENAGDSIITIDESGIIESFNLAAEKMFGYTAEETIGQNVKILMGEPDRSSHDHYIERYIKTGHDRIIGLSNREVMGCKKDGTLFPLELVVSETSIGERRLFIGIMRDMSEHKEAEEAIRQSEERYRTLANISPVGIYRTDSAANSLYVNERWCEITGLKMEEALGAGWQKALHPEDRQLVLDKWTKCIRENIPFKAEYRYLRADSVETWVIGQADAIRCENGETTGYVGTITDITNIKQAEKKLLLSKDEAEEANRTKSEFLSTMSHELRSPLNAVIGFSELLLRDSKDEMVHQLAPKIHDSGKYLLAMIEDLLDHERIDRGKVKLNMESFSINNLIAETVDSWQSRLPDGFSMTSDIDSTCRPVDCDSTRITQILNNLIDNAIKYSPEGGTIHITTLAAPEEIRVSVRDEGLGMSPEEMEMIFERFQQLESGYTRRAGGLGIGLALVRKLIKMHGGRIWVESQKGKGSTFTLALPRIPSAKTESPGQSGGAEEPGGGGGPWDGRTILIVDDVEHYHEYMKLLMRGAKRLEFAYNGLEAIETARRENPDLILMDLRMPVMDGFEAIEHLKCDPATKDIPILAVTAQVMEEDRVRSARSGANGFVTKPIDIEAFKKEVVRVLGVRV